MNTIQDILLSILLASIPAAWNHFLDYCFGEPMGDEPKTKEIFSFYSLALAKRRLKQKNLLDDVYSTFESMLMNDDRAIRRDGLDQLKKTIIFEGRKYFTFEKALGMCPICTNFWVSAFCSTIFYFTIPTNYIDPIFFFLLVPVFSHSILRKL